MEKTRKNNKMSSSTEGKFAGIGGGGGGQMRLNVTM